jgi:hypothetical protein
MTRATHIEVRRTAQAIAQLCRHVRRLRQRGGRRETDPEMRSFRCGDVLVVPSGRQRQWTALLDEIGGNRSVSPP